MSVTQVYEFLKKHEYIFYTSYEITKALDISNRTVQKALRGMLTYKEIRCVFGTRLNKNGIRSKPIWIYAYKKQEVNNNGK